MTKFTAFRDGDRYIIGRASDQRGGRAGRH